jgi:hypothetical protein
MSASGVGMPNPIRVATAPEPSAPRASQTLPGGRPGHPRETCMRPHGQVAGNRSLAKGGRRRDAPKIEFTVDGRPVQRSRRLRSFR